MMNKRAEDTMRDPVEERLLVARRGMPMLLLNTLLILLFTTVFVLGCVFIEGPVNQTISILMIVLGAVLAFCVCPVVYIGLRTLRPNEAMVLTLFGRYIGTLKGEGFYFVNPFATAVAPPAAASTKGSLQLEPVRTGTNSEANFKMTRGSSKVSLKTLTLNNEKQKINDSLGNPINIGIVVIWRVANTAKAMFNVDDFVEFLSIQCDSALRNIVRLYPYDVADSADDAGEKSLRGSSQEIAANLREAIQEKVDMAGLEVTEARITHLAYAPEIAAAMLQRQQAAAVVDARQLIVEGAVGMVEMALERLGEHGVVELDEERKAAMVSNLMVVLCGNRDAQPVVNSGSLY